MGNCCSVASISTCYFTTWTSSPQGDQHSLIIKPMLRRFTHQVVVVLSERERKSMWGVFFPVLNKHSCFHAEGHFSDEWSGRYPAISKNNKPATEAVLLTLKWLSLMWRCLGTSILGLLLLLKRSTYFVLHHICLTGDDYRYFSVLRWPKQKALSACHVFRCTLSESLAVPPKTDLFIHFFSCSVGLIKIKAQRAKSVRSFP